MSVALNEVLTISPAGRASREAYWFSLFAAFALMGASFVVFGFSPAAASFMGFEAAPVAEPVGENREQPLLRRNPFEGDRVTAGLFGEMTALRIPGVDEKVSFF